MITHLTDSTKQTADELIAMSVLLDKKMETWAEVFTRYPDSQNAGICAGFISDQTSVNPIEIVVDVQVPSDTDSGILRTKAIETSHDEQGNERFNNISLSFAVDRAKAQQLVEKGESITRENIQQLLHEDSSHLDSVVVSDESGMDQKSQDLIGARYDFESGELATMSEATEKELIETMDIVLARIKQTATTTAK